MNLPFNFRVRNIVDYDGPFGQYRNVRIIEIAPFDESKQLFTLEKSYQKDQTLAGYTEYIRPIFLTEGYLSLLGFQFDKKLKRHKHMNLTIGSFSYAEGSDPMHMTYISLGYRIIPESFPEIPTINQVKEGTTEVRYLHVLQNFCSDKAIESIDFSIIK